MLLATYRHLLDTSWRPVFAQARTRRRAIEHAVAWPAALGRRTISQTICVAGRQDRDWSADYKLFSRSRWQTGDLFARVTEEYLDRYAKGPILLALDDTRVPKTGKKIAGTSWQRDPMSPPFQVNLIWSQRFLQCSLLFPHHTEGDFSARAYPVGFEHVPAVKKPGKRASDEQREQYQRMHRLENLSTRSLTWVAEFRSKLDGLGAVKRMLTVIGDGSFSNRTFYKRSLDRVNLLTRCRKDARLCLLAPKDSGRTYAVEVFTPEDVRQSQSCRWRSCKIWHGHKRYGIRYKVVQAVLWRRGAGRRQLRLIVIAPVAYKTTTHSRRYYRQPGFLLCTDLGSPIRKLVQAYFDRWQIEVNHRDEKTLLAVGQAQVWSPRSIARQPGLTVASYSMLLLAGLLCYGPGRHSSLPVLPKWRTKSHRFSLLDLLALLRREIIETSVNDVSYAPIAKNLVLCAKT